tara:strand:- start:87 stop:392 length:306 start_codon:yes stop_codon:yes gene_type:complete
MEEMVVADTPILEFMEDKIDEHGREKIWGNKADWSKLNLDSDFEAELLVYDQMLTTVSNKVVCISCLKQDDELWHKYYDEGENGDDDSEPDDTEIVFDADF